MDASAPVPALLPAANCEVSVWFEREIRSHEASLRAFLHERFRELPDPDDIVQEAYARVLRARSRQELTNPKSYLFTIAFNLATDVFRRQRVVREDDLANFPELPVYYQDPSECSAREHKLQLLEKALDALPDRCRQVFVLKRFQGLSYEEISARMGISHNTISAHMMTAVAKMRDYLRAHGVNGSHP
jgi:RNA polymerase sigma-70 factor (ECF subfamily)